MARFVFACWPFAGHVHPSIAIARAVRARGHEVAFYTGESVRSTVEGEGFEFLPFRKVDEKRIVALVSSEFPYCSSLWQQLRNARRFQAAFREWLVDTIPQQVEDLDLVLSDRDVIVSDSSFWGPILALRELRQIPVAVLSVTAACVLPGPEVAVWGRGAPQPRTKAMRWRAQMLRSILYQLSAAFRANVNAIRRRYGLANLSCSPTEYAGQMPLYLVPSAPEYDYERTDLPASVHYVGPCLWDKANDTRPMKWLAGVGGDRPLIYVTEATVGNTEPVLLKIAVQALRDLPVEVVITTGKQRDPAKLDLGPPASNVRVEAYIPQSDLMPRTSVMITPGGSGGVLGALQAGVPLVIVPTEWDRPENAQRVAEAGAGIRIHPKHCTPERLRAAVQQILNDTSFRRNAQRLAGAFGRYGGPALAAQLLEDLSSNSVNCSKSVMRTGTTEAVRFC